MRPSIALVFALGLAACSTDPAVVSFDDVDSTGLAHFTLENRSDGDIADVTFELTYLSEAGDVLLIDTVSYRSGEEDGTRPPFLEAGEETFFMQRVPPEGSSASPSILELTYMDGSTWSAR